MTNISNSTTPTLNEQLLAMEAPVWQPLSWQAAGGLLGTAGLGLLGGHQLWRERRAERREDAQMLHDLDANERLSRLRRWYALLAESQASGTWVHR